MHMMLMKIVGVVEDPNRCRVTTSIQATEHDGAARNDCRTAADTEFDQLVSGNSWR
jgi:hypothetical protein